MSIFMKNYNIDKQIIRYFFTYRHLIVNNELYNNTYKPNIHERNLISPLINKQTFKYKHSKSRESDSESESDDEYDKSSKTDTTLMKVNSLRSDLILKTAFGISRNKLEVLFYQNNIKINNKSIPKKGAKVNAGDFIDIVKGPSPDNPNFLIVSRIEVESIKVKEDKYYLNVNKFKSLLIEKE